MPAGLRVLIIDSDHEFYVMIERLLRAWFGQDLDLIHLQDPAELEMARNSQTSGILDALDLVITELQFAHEPRSATELLPWLGDIFEEREVPVVVLTESPERNLQLRAFQAGVADYFEKSSMQLSLLEIRLQRVLDPSRRQKSSDAKSASDSTARELQDQQAKIYDLNVTIEQMRTELEQEYQNKLLLEKDKSRMQSVFGMYVDPKIVEGILSEEITVDQKGRRQNVTVMFADLRGYTSMTEDMESEKVISFLNEFFTSMTEVIMGYEGMVDKYIGDGIMCLFGTPLPDPEHRDRALLTAMEMFSIFELWQTNWETNYGIRPAMGIGLASGDVVVGNVGSFQKISYTAVGDTVNLAARLESMAKPGEVLVSNDLFENLTEASRSKYTFEPLDPIDIRGKRGKHQVYRLIQEFDADDILQFG